MSDPVGTDALREVVRERSSVLSMDEIAVVDAAADEVDRLRAVIDNAPHEVYPDGTACPAAYGEEDAVCTCWKADAV